MSQIITKTKPTLDTANNIYVKSYGCQMNVYDSQLICQMMFDQGFKTVDNPENATITVLNTCHIREKATEKIYSEIGRIAKIKKLRQEKQQPYYIIIAGCVAQAEGLEVIKRAPIVDAVVGPQTLQNIPVIVKKLQNGHKHIVETQFEPQKKLNSINKNIHKNIHANRKKISEFIIVQEGCNKFCSFCVVPYTRGAEYCRPADDIIKEARKLQQKGVREIILIGQNVNAYKGQGECGKKVSLAQLIQMLSDELANISRIRYTTSHPIDMSDDLIEQHRSNPKLTPWLHLPVQSGSNKILKDMKRKHTVEYYIDIIDKVRKAKPDIAISSDFIVGFPGESESDFQQTVEIVEKIGFANAYSFKYSPRPGTPAAKKTQLNENIKDERLKILQNIIKKQQRTFNQNMIGENISVLFEKHAKKPGQIAGRSLYMQMVHVNAPQEFIGTEKFVKIKNAFENSLTGDVVS